MIKITLSQMVQNMINEYGEDWAKINGTNCLIKLIELALSQEDLFFSIENFTYLKNIEEIIKDLLDQKALFVLPAIKTEER